MQYLSLPDVYIVGVASDLGIKDIYKKPMLNVSLARWDYEPIEVEEKLPQILDDMELFATMDDNKEEILS